MRRMKRYPRLRRRWASNRTVRVAERAGRLDALDVLGPLTLAALRRVRDLARDEGVEVDELDEVTLEAVLEGRGGAR